MHNEFNPYGYPQAPAPMQGQGQALSQGGYQAQGQAHQGYAAYPAGYPMGQYQAAYYQSQAPYPGAQYQAQTPFLNFRSPDLQDLKMTLVRKNVASTYGCRGSG